VAMRYYRHMNLKRLRPYIAIVILLGTASLFTYFFIRHPEVRHQLAQTSPQVIALLLALYIAGIGALAMITNATVRLCNIKMPGQESLLLTMYSSIINFFGPLQSGPAFRAVYLRKRYQLDLKRYGIATLVYYFFYAGFSCLFLLSTLLKWWLLPLALLGLLLAWLLPKFEPFKSRLGQLDLHNWYYLAFATLLQVSIVGLIYYRELVSVAPGTDFSQAVVYTGAANLALFVSLTPGAIGFRESFLLFSQRLHHINADTIVSANILDRAMYIILLLLLALFVFGTHASRRLKKAATD
jgi:uncharacterized membrane protein YbhN (UPF0104 family)